MSKISLNSNSASLQAQRLFKKNTASFSSTHERLSSGLRINRAQDDAAGLAIASSLRVTERVYGQAIRNLNDGFSYLQIAEGATGELQSVVIRLAELSEQAANGTLSHTQRRALDTEAQALKREYERIVAATTFNGEKVFRPGDSVALQAGFGSTESLNFEVGTHLARQVGTGEFVLNGSYAISDAPASVRLVDVNNDGIPDLMTGSDDSSRVTVRLGLGDGEFGDEVRSGTGSNRLTSFATADFNNDGILDVVVENGSGSSSVRVGFGEGDGRFASFMQFSVLDGPESLVAEDFNGDGNMDFAVQASGPVLVFTGDGAGNFSAPQVLPAPDGGTIVSSYESLQAADLNGDGLIDLVAARDSSSNANIRSFINQGDGTFSAGIALNLEPLAPGPVTLGDFNDDGIIDAVVGVGSTSVKLLKGRGDGSFESGPSFALGGSEQVRLLDINGDGRLDLIGINRSTGTLHTAFGDGQGNFEAAGTFTESLATPRGIDAHDLNGDGVKDLVIANAGEGGSVSILFAETVPDVTLSEFSLITKESALEALTLFSKQLNVLSAERGSIGASSSRIQAALNNLLQRREAIKEAESRISDADMAGEAAEFVKASILQQASVAVMSLANYQPERMLSLIQS